MSVRFGRLGWRFRVALFVPGCLLLNTPPGIFSAPPKTHAWSRVVNENMPPGVRFAVLSISSISGRLSATCAYQLTAPFEKRLLSGFPDVNGHFAPRVAYEVGPAVAGPWKRLDQQISAEPAETLQMDTKRRRIVFHIDMEPFKKFVTAYRWGRIVISDEETAIVDMEDLLPTAPNGSDFKIDVDDLDPLRLGSSFTLVSVTSISGKITGNFAFCGEQPTEVRGIYRNSDFYVNVTLQVGVPTHWEAISDPETVASKEKLSLSNRHVSRIVRVRLTAFKGLQSRFQYAKINFSKEAFAVFPLSQLAGVVSSGGGDSEDSEGVSP